jgi:(E)-4-hydroxy-3-methylbut-2-enyl-diphosphate synthase
VPHIREQLDRMGIDVPLVGDFHYNGHRLLTDFPAMARRCPSTASTPATSARATRSDRQFGQMIEVALRTGQGGAHRRQLGQPGPGTAGQPDGRERPRAQPWDARQVMYQALIQSA